MTQLVGVATERTEVQFLLLFNVWAILVSPDCLSSLSTIYKYLAVDSVGIIRKNSFHEAIKMGLNALRRSLHEQVSVAPLEKQLSETNKVSKYNDVKATYGLVIRLLLSLPTVRLMVQEKTVYLKSGTSN